MSFVDVALLTGGLERPLTYALPPGLSVAAGYIVTAPVQSRLLTGIVLALRDTLPKNLSQAREIHSVVDAQPALDAPRMALAHWIAREYYCGVGRACAIMVPPGYTPRSSSVYSIDEGARTAGADASETHIIDTIKRRGSVTEARLATDLRKHKIPGWRNLLKKLIQRGWVTRSSTLELPKPRTTRSTLVQLAISTPTLDLARANLNTKTSAANTRRLAAFAHIQAKNGLVWADWLMAETGATRADLHWMQQRGYVRMGDAERWRDPLSDIDYVSREAPPLTSDQAAAWAAIEATIDPATQASIPGPGPSHFLLRGVTGSGKTEVYMRAVDKVLRAGRAAIVLVPEISLTPQTARRFLERFPGQVALIHSRLRPGERYDTWRRIRNGDLNVVVGARSGLFAPVKNLGLIVLDEEHDASYKQDHKPHYDARRVARKLAEIHGATLIFGSATPSLEAMHEFVDQPASSNRRFLELPNRVRSHALRMGDVAARLGLPTQAEKESDTVVYQPMPAVQVVDMRAELRDGNTSMFSRALHMALTETLSRGEQALLFLNRRGMASCVVCRDCGLALRCPNDDVPLTLHGGGTNVNRKPMLLKCHQCDHSEPSPKVCPSCGSSRIKFIGLGTQRIEEFVTQNFPKARVLRWDRDTASQRGAAENLLQRFVNRQADVLIGTQMIAKGLDLPMVTLVGIVLADVGLFLPDFRASERVFDLIEQVAGRAGRSLLRGRVIVQSYNPQHPAIAFAQHHDVKGFADYELNERKKLDLSPFTRLARFEFSDESEEKAREACNALARELRKGRLDPASLIGPAACYFGRKDRHFRWQVIARADDPARLLENITVPPGCVVDVDPMGVL